MRNVRIQPMGILLLLVVGGCSGSILPSHLHDPDRAARTAKLAPLIDAFATGHFPKPLCNGHLREVGSSSMPS